MVQIYRKAPGEVDRMEVFRYAKCLKPGGLEQEQLNKACKQVFPVIQYRLCYGFYPIKHLENHVLDLGFTRVHSEKLYRHIADCTQICLFAATLGTGFDREMLKAGIKSPLSEMLVGALGSERIEALCDDFNNALKQKVSDTGGSLKSRFSPGYGDLTLAIQKDIFTALSPEKNIGLTLNSTLFMTPVKSVTAIIGITAPQYFEETI